jgi:hypothetical protein
VDPIQIMLVDDRQAIQTRTSTNSKIDLVGVFQFFLQLKNMPQDYHQDGDSYYDAGN